MLLLSLSICTKYMEMYNIFTSLFCYRLLKPHLSGNSEVFWDANVTNRIFEPTAKNKVYPAGFSFEPDIDNTTSVAIACRGLTSGDCQRWLSCSKSARVCCQDYVAKNISSVETPDSHCQTIWDGMSCVNSVPNGTMVSIKCPDYYIPVKRPANFTKTCLSNGDWDSSHLDVNGAHILTNYSACKAASKDMLQVLGADELHLETVVTLATNVISLAFLLPSFALVTLLRNSVTSETEKRKLMIHFHFLGSLILVSVFTLSWDWIIAKEHVEKLYKEMSLIDQNSPICKTLLCLQKYMRSATYFWMFVEGLNILIPLCRAFQGKIQRRWLYFIGWGIPLSTVIIYAVIRTTIDKYDSKCWIYHYVEIEWIVLVPNYLTVLCNFVFLIVIMVNIILRNRRDSSIGHRGGATFPQSIRSLICLIFLFGINFIVPWIMLAVDSETIIPYIFKMVVEGLQGVFVCVLWVFCSKEIQHNFKRIVQRKFPLLFQRFQGRKFSTSSHTHLTQAIYPVAAAPIVLDSSKVTERLERIMELPDTERHSRETEKLTTIDTSSRNSFDVELPLRHALTEEGQRTKGECIPEKERLTGETERSSQELYLKTNNGNLEA